MGERQCLFLSGFSHLRSEKQTVDTITCAVKPLLTDSSSSLLGDSVMMQGFLQDPAPTGAPAGILSQIAS